MKLYLYDEITKEYVEEIEAYLDPEETKIQGKKVYMYPANATDIEPPTTKEHEIVIFENDNWVIKPDYRGLYQCSADLIATPIDKFGELEEGYIVITEEQYNKILEDNLYYVVLDGELVENPNYEQDITQKERERVAMFSLTRGDVFRGLLMAKGVTRAQLRAMIETNEQLTEVEKEMALIDFDEALNFYRGNALIDTVGLALGISSEQLDKFFETNDYTTLL